MNPRVHLHVPGTLDDHAVKINAADLGSVDHRIITSLEARIAAIGRDAEGFEYQLPQRERELAEAEANLGQPFKHAHLLKLTRDQLAEIDKKMAPHDEGTTEHQSSELNIEQSATPKHGAPASTSTAHHRAHQWRTAPATDTGYGR